MEDTLKHTFKIVIIGDEGVGKTCMLANFTGSIFPSTYIPTSENTLINQHLKFMDKEINLELWDLPGADKHRTSSTSRYYKAHGVVIAYSMTDYESLSHVRSWYENINHVLPKETLDSLQSVVIGLKCDSEYASVPVAEGESIAADLQCKHFTGSCRVPGSFTGMFDKLIISMYTEQRRLIDVRGIVDSKTPLLSNYQSHNGIVVTDLLDHSIKMKKCKCCHIL